MVKAIDCYIEYNNNTCVGLYVFCCFVLFRCFVLFCFVLFCLLFSFVLLFCFVVLCCFIVLFCVVLFCFVVLLCCVVLFYCFVLCCFVLFCFVLGPSLQPSQGVYALSTRAVGPWRDGHECNSYNKGMKPHPPIALLIICFINS